MRKIVLLVCVLFSLNVMAQNGRDFFSRENISKNWSVGAELGMQTPFNGRSPGKTFGHETTPAFAFFVGKDLTEVWHARIKMEGFGLHSSYQRETQDTRYLAIHADVMLSILSAFFEGSHKWDLLPYVGLGYYHGCHRTGQPVANMMSTHFGLKAQWSIQPRIDLFAEGGIAVLPDGFDRHYSGRNQEGIGSLMIGVSWKLSKQNNN